MSPHSFLFWPVAFIVALGLADFVFHLYWMWADRPDEGHRDEYQEDLVEALEKEPVV